MPKAIDETTPDAELIAACERFIARERQVLDLYYGPNLVLDDDKRDVLIDPLREGQRELAEAIRTMRSTTMEAHQARARAAVIFGPDIVDGSADISENIAAGLLHDLAGADWVTALQDYITAGEVRAEEQEAGA